MLTAGFLFLCTPYSLETPLLSKGIAGVTVLYGLYRSVGLKNRLDTNTLSKKERKKLEQNFHQLSHFPEEQQLEEIITKYKDCPLLNLS